MKTRINYAETTRAAYAEYREIIAVCPWMKCRETINECLRNAFRAAHAAAAIESAPAASAAWDAMTEDNKLEYLRKSAADMPRRAQAHTVWKDGVEIPAPSVIASWMGESESWKDSIEMVAGEAYCALIDRYLPRADDENRRLSWAVSRAVWAACTKLNSFYHPGSRSKYRTQGIEAEARLEAPRPAAPDSAALDRCEIEAATGESNAAAVIEALDTIPGNAPQEAVAAHIAAAAGENINTAIFTAIAAGVEQRYIADALGMTQQAVSYRLRKMRAAAETPAAPATPEKRPAPAPVTTPANSASPAPYSAAAPADRYAASVSDSPRHGDIAAAYIAKLASPATAPKKRRPRKNTK